MNHFKHITTNEDVDFDQDEDDRIQAKKNKPVVSEYRTGLMVKFVMLVLIAMAIFLTSCSAYYETRTRSNEGQRVSMKISKPGYAN